MSAFRIFVCFIFFVLPTSAAFSLKRFMLRLSGIVVDEGVCFCSHGWIYGAGQVSIGRNTWFSPGNILYTNTQAAIIIGKNCDFGPRVTILTGSHNIGSASRRAGPGIALPVVIGDGCWIGAGSLILGGVTIGNGAVIAAGSVVTKDVSPNCLYAGVPAKFKRLLKDDA